VDAEPLDLLALVRARCGFVASRARSVEIDRGRIEAYAATLVEPGADRPVEDPWAVTTDTDDESRAALVVTLDAINFGSGYHPEAHKLPGCSGATTMATRLRAWARAEGAVRADRLAGLEAPEVHLLFGQPETDSMIELMGLFTRALNELGRFVVDEHGSSFLALVGSAEGSANRLTRILAALPTYADVAVYDGQEVPLLKRAQITAADLHRAFHGRGPGSFADIGQLTAFADNLVPHVLRVDGILRLDPDLEQAIDRGELLVHGAAPEVELRACGVHVVELLRAAAAASGGVLSSAQIDQTLWTRGGGPRYKAVPRPRARTTAY